MTNCVAIHARSNFDSIPHEGGENVRRMRSVITNFLPHFFYSTNSTISRKLSLLSDYGLYGFIILVRKQP